jgi:hypothetical protein
MPVFEEVLALTLILDIDVDQGTEERLEQGTGHRGIDA